MRSDLSLALLSYEVVSLTSCRRIVYGAGSSETSERLILENTFHSGTRGGTTVVATASMDSTGWLRQQPQTADIDLLCEMVRVRRGADVRRSGSGSAAPPTAR